MSNPPSRSMAFRAGLIAQAIGLAVVIAAIVIQLLFESTNLMFRYGGF